MYKICKITVWVFMVLLTCLRVYGQNYPIKVQVQLVQPFYPYISDYKQKSIISFTSLSRTPMDIYIQAKLENDRGQWIQTAPNHYSMVPVHVPALQTVVVQGFQLDTSFFDLHNLQTNLDSRTKNALYQYGMIPEGFYRYCVTAFRRDGTGNYIAVSDPNGSCGYVNVGYIQPPLILSPMTGDSIAPNPVQNIDITWTRPVGNLHGAIVTYDLYLVKALDGQNPELAMNNALQYGAGLFMKEEKIPSTTYRYTRLSNFPLEEGSKYALMVQARDLNGNAAFLNGGRSEISVFTYGKETVANTNSTQDGNQIDQQEDMKVLKGKLVWAFKESEKETVYQNTYSSGPDVLERSPQNYEIEAPDFVKPVMSASAKEAKPFYPFIPEFVINADPTAIALTENMKVTPNNNSSSALPNSQVSMPNGVHSGVVSAMKNYTWLVSPFSATASKNTKVENIFISVDTNSQRYPLTGVKVTLMGSSTQNPGKKTLLGTGMTDADGEFSITFLDPGFQNVGSFQKLQLSVQVKDFENTVFEMAAPDGGIPDLWDFGTKVLLARTWRLFPKVLFEQSDVTDFRKCELHIYRKAENLQARPWLREEGHISGQGSKKLVIDGSEVIEIASMTIEQQTALQWMTQMAITRKYGEGVGRLFFGGDMVVKIIPESDSYRTITSHITTFPKSLSSNQVMTGEVTYELQSRTGHIAGNVSMFLDGQPSIPVSGAVVRIMYHKSDVIEKAPLLAAPIDVMEVIGPHVSTNRVLAGLTQDHLQEHNAQFTGPTPALMIVSGGSTSNNTASTPFAIKPVIPSDKAAPSPVCADCSYKIDYTDHTGNYYIANLPVLKPEAQFIIEVIQTPSEFRLFDIARKDGSTYPSDISVGKGVSRQVDFVLRADVVNVVGRVVDKESKELTGVRLVFKGNTLTTSGIDGLFAFKLYPGNHTIMLEKEGYIPKEVILNIPGGNKKSKEENSRWGDLTVAEMNDAVLTNIKAMPSVRASVSSGRPFDATLLGFSTGNATQSAYEVTPYNAGIVETFNKKPSYSSKIKLGPSAVDAVDMHDIGYLEKIIGMIQFTVKDLTTNQPIPDAQISLFDTSHVTDEKGQWYYEGYGGAAIVTVVPPSSAGYVAEQKTLTLAENGKVLEVTLFLERGIEVTGMVTSGSTPLAGAKVWPEGEDHLATLTDETGHYTLYVKKGVYNLSALLHQYVGQETGPQSIPEDGTVFNFILKGGNGKNYGKLLGFDVELSKATRSGEEELWSGNFINIQSRDPSVFVMDSDLRIPFSNVRVHFDNQGNAIPAGDEVKTDITHIPLKAFGYLPADFVNGSVITITDAGNHQGHLQGKVQVNFNAIRGYRGWTIPGETAILMAPANMASQDIILIQSENAHSEVNVSWELVTETGNPIDALLYGFHLHLHNNAPINSQGLGFAGTISTPALPMINPMDIGLKQFNINSSLEISEVQIDMNNQSALDIAGWQAHISNIAFNSDGFRIGGKVSVTIPASGNAEIEYAELLIAKDEIFGGKFTIPSTGINLLSVANLNTGGTPLSFGRVGGSTVYRIAGKANLKINLDLFTSGFEIPTFEVLTDGSFNLQAPVRYSTTLGPFGFSVSNLYINTTAGTPFIGIQGGFRTDLDFIRFEVADIKVRAGSNGPDFTIEKIGVSMDVPLIKVSALVSFRQNGFEGVGSLNIPATPIGGSISFRYYETGGSIDLGAHFSVNIPPVPIGVIVTLEGIGGGFDYVNGNISVDVNGKLSLLGTGTAIALDPLGLTVSSRGILRGYGDVSVASYLKTAHAETIFNGPEATFTVQVSAQMSPMEGLLEQQIRGALVISAKKGDEYAFLGCSVQVNILGLVNGHGEMAIAVGLNNPRNHDDLTSHYFRYAPTAYIQNNFSGVYINVAVQLGIPHDRALGFDITIASARLWCSSAFQAGLILNFAEGSYLIKFGGKFDAGIEACVADIACVNLSAGLCYEVEGGRNDTDGWNFSATASGQVRCGFGIGIGDCSPGCNEIETFWDGCIGGSFQVCAGGYLDFGFSERRGLNLTVRGGESVPPCF